MRPYGEARICMAAALMDGPGTTRQLATRTGCSQDLAMYTLRNMVAAGDAQKLKPARVPGVKRPVPVYARAIRQIDTEPANDNPFISLISAWMGRPAA